ncbi:MAG: hypothetical protein ACI9W4_001339 [Rhodothermales bacterium]|jgi:hypothetical protein
MPHFRRSNLIVLALLLSVVGLTSCELLGDTSLPDYASIANISYVRDVQVLFDDQCAACHDGSQTPLDLTSMTGLRAGTDAGGAVIPFAADRSRLIRMLSTRTGGVHPVDVGQEAVTEAEFDFLKRWIDAGARDDDGQPMYADAAHTAIASFPDEALIAILDTDRLAVARLIDLESLGFAASSRPTAVAAIPDGSGWFVSLPGEGIVLRFDSGHTLRGLAEIESAGALDASFDGAWLVSGRIAGRGQDQIETVETGDMRVFPTQSTFPDMQGVAIRPQGDIAYAASRSADQMALILVGKTQPTYVGMDGPRHAVSSMVVTPDGSTLVAFGSQSGQGILFDLTVPESPRQTGVVDFGGSLLMGTQSGSQGAVLTTSGQVRVAELAPGSIARTLAINSQATSLGAAGSVLVVGSRDTGLSTGPNFSDQPVVGVITVLDAATGQVLRHIQVDGVPGRITGLFGATPTKTGRQ